MVENKGFVRCRIVQFTPTDTPNVYSALLACGHVVRYNVHGSARAIKTKRCAQCTAIHKQQRGETHGQ